MGKSIGTWILASRPWSFTMSFFSVTIGAAWAARESFSLGWYLLTLIGMVALHGGTNLMNDYFDVKNRVDTPEVPTVRYRPHPLMQKEIDLGGVLKFSLALFAVGIVSGLVLTAFRGLPILWIGLAGVAVGVFYTAPPLSLKYHALGEPAVFFMWGPLAVLGSYYVQVGHFSLDALVISIPFGVLVALVLLANNVRDRKYDETKKIRTLPVLLGARAGQVLYGAFMAAAFLAVGLMALFGPLSPWSLLVFLAVPLAVPLFKRMATSPPDNADAMTAKLDTAFAALFLVSLVLQNVL